ncbi:hypothetical protein BJV78DRAFT_1284011 [Lactifluus subvellereus]|nr:hypothetical protein BJV78DRAFT_1284011 [Lactifluus subvellereus]
MGLFARSLLDWLPDPERRANVPSHVSKSSQRHLSRLCSPGSSCTFTIPASWSLPPWRSYHLRFLPVLAFSPPFSLELTCLSAYYTAMRMPPPTTGDEYVEFEPDRFLDLSDAADVHLLVRGVNPDAGGIGDETGRGRKR